MAKVVAIEKNSVAEELGIEVGDELLGFDGQPIVDILDYLYYDGQENFVMNMRAKQGDIVDMDIEKYENETLGLSLDESVDLEPIRCQNKCMFCFVDQLPCGMRDTLYVKD
ncbi:MAG: PDZ domain-containing protein, partial [Clostridia bacterium]